MCFLGHNMRLIERALVTKKVPHRAPQILKPQSQLKLCPFHSSFKTNSQYICYKYEKCCRQGCCSTYSYTYFQSWYFWLIIVIFFAVFYIASWYCKKLDNQQKLQWQTNVRSTISSNSPRQNNESSSDNFFDYILQSYRGPNSNEHGSAPIRDNINLDPPPKYQDVIKMTNNVQVAQIHSGMNRGARRCNNLDSIRMRGDVPPTYEVAMQNSSRNDRIVRKV